MIRSYKVLQKKATQNLTQNKRTPCIPTDSVPWDKIKLLRQSVQRVYKYLLYSDDFKKGVGARISMRQLAKKLELDKDTISLAIRDLEQGGFISIKRSWAFGRPKSNVYNIIPHKKPVKKANPDMVNSNNINKYIYKDKKPTIENDILNFAAKRSFLNDPFKRKFLFYDEKQILKRLEEIVHFKHGYPYSKKKAWAIEIGKKYGLDVWKAMEGYLSTFGKQIKQKGGLSWFCEKLDLILHDFKDYQLMKTERKGLHSLKSELTRLCDFGGIGVDRLNRYLSRLFQKLGDNMPSYILTLKKCTGFKVIKDFSDLLKMTEYVLKLE